MDDKTALGNERKLSSSHDDFQQQQSNVIYDAQEEPKGSLVQRFFRKTWQQLLEPGSALQIVIAAAVAIGIGLAVSSTVDDIPRPASVILAIPGQLWLRALKAVGKLRNTWRPPFGLFTFGLTNFSFHQSFPLSPSP